MHTYQFKLEIKGSFITPFWADTIFGGLCWVIREREGSHFLTDMLQDFCNGDPWFVLSNAFPGDLLPKPLIKIKRPSPLSKEAMIMTAKEDKSLKKIRFLTLTEFGEMINGRRVNIQKKDSEIIPGSTLHNQINRITGLTGEGGGLYEQEELYLNPAYSYLSVYVKLKDPQKLEWLKEIFRHLGRTGLGKRKSTGKGAFELVQVEECGIFENISSPNAFLSLSHFVPAPTDPTQGSYRFLVKYGKLGEILALAENPFKKPLLMVEAGSVFRLKDNFKPYYGQMVPNIAYGCPEVVQYGLAFSVPVRLEE